MINLIPNTERKKMIRDLYLRLVVVVFFAISFCVFAASVLLLPSYFASMLKINLMNTKLLAQKKEPVPKVEENITDGIKDLNHKLGIIEKSQKNNFLISQKVINEILLKKTSNIKITEIAYENNTDKGKKISINGIAPSREKLLSFRKALEDNPNFSKVDLPISNFIKDSNIQFSITLMSL